MSLCDAWSADIKVGLEEMLWAFEIGVMVHTFVAKGHDRSRSVNSLAPQKMHSVFVVCPIISKLEPRGRAPRIALQRKTLIFGGSIKFSILIFNDYILNV